MSETENTYDDLQAAFEQLLLDLRTEDDDWYPELLRDGDIHLYADPDETRALCESVVNELEMGVFEDVTYDIVVIQNDDHGHLCEIQNITGTEGEMGR